MAVTITLSDGSKLEGLSLNGNNFISKNPITENIFKGKLSHVIISGDVDASGDAGLIGEHNNMELVRCELDEGLGGYAFVLRDIPADKLAEAKIKSDIAYLSMMSGVDLDE